MTKPLSLHGDRLFSSDPVQRGYARELYALVKDFPILSPHGHTDPSWFALNEPFENATALFLSPDHYIYRMLYSQGIDLDDVGVGSKAGPSGADPRAAWRIFAKNQHLFRGTPTSMWMGYVFGEIMGFDVQLSEDNADFYFDRIGELLATDAYRPRALFDRFNIELLATTEGPTDTLEHHRTIKDSGWKGRVVTAYRPDPVIDPEHEDFHAKLAQFADLTGEDVYSWKGYLRAHRKQRDVFMEHGATSTDHGHPTAQTANLSTAETKALFKRVTGKHVTPEDAELFRAQMLTEMARMSLDDGLTMQIHPGSFRNHNLKVFEKYGRDKGCDIPLPTNYVHALKPLLDVFGNEKNLTVIVFTLDETNYSRELAPLAGHYPILKLGPSWWFHDSPEGMTRFREQVTETAGFYNTVGFNDDTRAFLSIPARHDVARRVDANFLARLVAEHRLDLDDAAAVIKDLTYTLPKAAYKL
ncbi:glucuronate isomerase [Asticcacaulis sp. AC460]|uniref:glucuronate isomerase n=1 Tax=Asticcacaulis sp. AC460 TaxID=1282360 RepID=UPI0003C3AD3E|nr:glucuronate isomerase [Asticcacaulis sp. AC460]ESQ93066.1 glucuronate isomerase [Asticcacaulis sp. AC460]